MKLVSVIIPMYNSSKTIKDTIYSAIKQTYSNIEIIVINDGSTDNGKEIVEKIIIENPSFNLKLINQSNKGVSSARNLGLKNARGRYIAFLDADDKWCEDKLFKQVEYMDNNPDVALTGTLITNGKTFKKKKKVQNVSFQKLLFKNYFMTPSVLVRKKIVDEIGYFNQDKKYSEDYDFWLKIAIKYPTVLLLDQLVTLSEDRNGLSSNLLSMQLGELKNYKDLLKGNYINFFNFITITIFSLLKFFKRVLMIKGLERLKWKN